MAKRNYYKTNYIKHVEKLDLNYPEKIWRRGWARFGGPVPPGLNVEPPLRYTHVGLYTVQYVLQCHVDLTECAHP